jgi:hypothetical protein
VSVGEEGVVGPTPPLPCLVTLLAKKQSGPASSLSSPSNFQNSNRRQRRRAPPASGRRTDGRTDKSKASHEASDCADIEAIYVYVSYMYMYTHRIYVAGGLYSVEGSAVGRRVGRVGGGARVAGV